MTAVVTAAVSPLDRLSALVAAMTARPWLDDTEGGFIVVERQDIDGENLAQTWNKEEEDFRNAAANRAGIVALANVATELLTLARVAARVAETPYNAIPNADALRLLKHAGYNLSAKLAEITS